ncbi:MAG: glycosyltransferase family 1 protein, partial [Aeromicrobium sp.]|nr:glycosyltransferase family 1 protein [Aeromicrobium sp.]
MTGSEWFTTRPGGLNRYFESLYLALRDHPGVKTHAAAFGDPPEGGHAWSQATGVAARHRTSRRKPQGLKPTVVDRHFALYGPGIPLRSSTPFVLHFQGPWHAESRASGESALSVRAKHAFEALRYARADHAVVLCEEFRDILHERYRFPASRISVIPPGVDLERFQSAPVPTSAAPLVLCVRRLERRMGIDVLIAAWQDVVRTAPDARLVVVGDGSERGALQRQIDALGLAASITLAGRVDDDTLGRYYREARLTVIPTRALEGFGLIALESLASGRAPIVT